MDNRAYDVCWALLFEEILIQIFSKLDFESLISVASVCHSWRSVAHYPECWDCIQLYHQERFVDNCIKETEETEKPEYQDRLFKESEYMIRHVGGGVKSICVHPIADDTMVQMIADRCPSIESISLRDCGRISPAALLNLIRTCKHLKFIDVKFCSAASASVIQEMGQSCPSLVGLNLGHLRVTEEMSTGIRKFMPKLKWLNLNSATIYRDVLFSILDSSTELEYVSIRCCHPRLIMDDELINKARRIEEFKYTREIYVGLRFPSIRIPACIRRSHQPDPRRRLPQS
ncbi:F-box protein SKIP1-like [Magnolia sinica]|uniref:F-box protein SKIP1-like n=1 Tax=Magnolia sinica TaxID=86752 RepID=UPI00265ABFDD|nr:F-box protein SKIP1-like [Magnolia sinica]